MDEVRVIVAWAAIRICRRPSVTQGELLTGQFGIPSCPMCGKLDQPGETRLASGNRFGCAMVRDYTARP
jgi:hypothetical protein